ncbi:hypothetical protein ACQEV4_40240 [Streptomyces shenzhenensis]|uniref:hypothetical protein n=1 Tax=Streptomyces shenzhenensis TaxID=943815 RepID=UPI003D92BF68
MNTDETNTDDAGELPPGVRVIDFRQINWTQDPEEAHAEALEIEAEREAIAAEWDEFDDEELDDIADLAEFGYLTIAECHGELVPPSRYEYNQAVKARNPDAFVGVNVEEKRRAIIGLLNGEDSGCPTWVDWEDDAAQTFSTLEWFSCLGECGCEEPHQRGRGLFAPSIPNLIFGEGGTGKTELQARLHAEMIRAGLNTVHYEFEWDSGEEMVSRIAALGVSRVKINRHLRVLIRPTSTPTFIDDMRGAIDPTDTALVTLDSVTRAAYCAWEMKADVPEVMDRILREFIRPFTESGACAVLTDHVGQVIKNRPRGDKGKTDAIQGAVYRMEKVSDGHSRLVWFKDNSNLRPEGVKLEDVAAHMRITKTEGKTTAVDFYADGEPLPKPKRTAPVKRDSAGPRPGSTADLILKFVTAFKSTADIQGYMRSAHGTGRNTITQTLGRLVDSGRLRKDETRDGYEPV